MMGANLMCMDAHQFYAEGLEVVGGGFDGCLAEQRADGDSSAPDGAIRRPASGTDIPSRDRPSDYRMVLMFPLSIRYRLLSIRRWLDCTAKPSVAASNGE